MSYRSDTVFTTNHLCTSTCLDVSGLKTVWRLKIVKVLKIRDYILRVMDISMDVEALGGLPGYFQNHVAARNTLIMLTISLQINSRQSWQTIWYTEYYNICKDLSTLRPVGAKDMQYDSNQGSL